MKKKIAVFDLDYTLIECNSTFDFVIFYLFKKRKFLRLFLSYLYLFLESIGLLSFLAIKKREIFLSLLKKEKSSDIKKISNLFSSDVLAKKMNNNIHKILVKRKEEGYFCILASASLDFIVKPFAKKMHFDSFIATQSDFNNNLFTGKIKIDAWGAKDKKIDHFFKKDEIDYEESFCYSDNREDLLLLKKFGNSFAVIKNSNERYFWEENKIHTVQKIKTFYYSKFLLLFPSFYYFYAHFSLSSFFFFHASFLLLFLIAYDLFSFLNLLVLFISWIGYISLYEIGYFINDCMAIKKENHPNFRADDRVCGFTRYPIFLRILFFLAISFFLLTIYPLFAYHYILFNILISFVFFIHNNVVPPRRIFTFPILSSSHLWVPLTIFNINLLSLLVIILLFHTPDELFHYHRKIKEQPLLKRKLIIRIIILGKLFLFLSLTLLVFLNLIPWQLLLLSFWLSALTILKIFNFLMKNLFYKHLLQKNEK